MKNKQQAVVLKNYRIKENKKTNKKNKNAGSSRGVNGSKGHSEDQWKND